ncbi:SDR family oxidoreductase [Vibrio hannami]|uniref:SDR family oxidoreductase n=1 Tax=Vibrio hannami TaxID=2717094 RepID=UPI0024103982|nr:SDR family oxidoreductase [Vibrio hannami]MDG3086217.1 SDR family oxidoreductase [Vibrio hannami]
MSKVAVVTGTSTGLGISIAIQLAKSGYNVFATMRNLEKRAQLDAKAKEAGVDINVRQLDVVDTGSVDRCIEEILQQTGRIDLLVNNAGAGFVRTTEQATEEEIRWVMDVNFHGVVRCIKAVLPHMRENRAGHIINVSSVGGMVGQPFNEFYCAAKFALEGYVESVATYITPHFGINFTNLEPGGIKTEFANNVLAQFQQTGGMLDDEYRPILEKYIGGAQERSADGSYQDANEVANVLVEIALMEEPPIRSQTSDWSRKFVSLKTQGDPTGKLQQTQIASQLL